MEKQSSCRLLKRTITNLQLRRVMIFFVNINKICVEMNCQSGKTAQEVLVCFSCVDLNKFDIEKLAHLAAIYRADFSKACEG